jgi:hypothetical protein
MAMRIADIKAWLDTLSEDAEVGVDEGGLTLVVLDLPDVYLEIGGVEPPPILERCQVCEQDGSQPYIPHGSADAFCTNCGADWPSNQLPEGAKP